MASVAQSPPPPMPPLRHDGLAARLFDACADWASACLFHPFVAGLADGTTPLEQFKAYVGQDAFFLEGFARAYALALAKAPPGDIPTLLKLSAFISGVADELRLHSGYAHSLGVDLTAAAATPLPATVAYVDFLLSIARDGSAGVSHVLAAMAPCMRLYAYLGRQLRRVQEATGNGPAAEPVSDGVDNKRASGYASHYNRWIETYSDPGVCELAGEVERLMERHATREFGCDTSSGAVIESNSSGGKRTDLGDANGDSSSLVSSGEAFSALLPLYRKAFELEYGFFDAFSWAPKGAGGNADNNAIGSRAGTSLPSCQGSTMTARPVPQLLLVVDWDETIINADTTPVYARLAARAAYERETTTAATAASSLAHESALAVRADCFASTAHTTSSSSRATAVASAWSALEGQYFSRYSEVAKALLSRLGDEVSSQAESGRSSSGGAFHPLPLLRFACRLSAFDHAAVGWCMEPIVQSLSTDTTTTAAGSDMGAVMSPPPAAVFDPRLVLAGIPRHMLVTAALTGLPPIAIATTSGDASSGAAAAAAIPAPPLRPWAAHTLAGVMTSHTQHKGVGDSSTAMTSSPFPSPAWRLHVVSINWS